MQKLTGVNIKNENSRRAIITIRRISWIKMFRRIRKEFSCKNFFLIQRMPIKQTESG